MHMLGTCSCARSNVIHSIEERLGASYRVVEILFWPEHFVVIEIASIEQIEADAFQAAIPTFRISICPPTRMVGQQSAPDRIAVMVERHYSVRHEDMVPAKPSPGMMRSA